MFDRRKWTSQDMKEDILFHVSNVFNPVHLFHLFLAEVNTVLLLLIMEMGKSSVGICDIMISSCFQLHYDHQVLLDYLISKDTGTDCAEYLLRCLF